MRIPNLPESTSVRSRFRRLTSERHPLLATMSRDEMYDRGRMMAPGGMLLARMMARHLAVAPGARILDIGCGRGQTSVMLASTFGADVVSVDLWVSTDERQRMARDAGVSDRILALQGDITRGLACGRAAFDAIFVMQAFHSFGARRGVLEYLSRLLKPGGRIVIGQTCFRSEPDAIPDMLRDDDGWSTEYGRYHSPDWWRALFQQGGHFAVDSCAELPDGDIFWEDHAIYCGDRAGWSEDFMARHGWIIRHIDRSISDGPHLTHFILSATKQNP
jgi:cyclopropane fatty-acyl-phospholipid synthase-like methyltransferase